MTDHLEEAPNAEMPAEPIMHHSTITEKTVPASPRLDAIFSIPVTLELVLASIKMPVSKLMEVQIGSELDLNHPAGAEVKLMVNGSQIAFGNLFLIDPQSRRVGVRISRLASASQTV
jgi:flagellar motor switch/type III secretory pathway protein FliN